jgi:hypothetical protein
VLSRRIERASVHERRAIRAEEKPDKKTAAGGIIGVIAPRRAAQRSKSATRILPIVHSSRPDVGLDGNRRGVCGSPRRSDQLEVKQLSAP